MAQQGLDIANSVQNAAQNLPGALTPRDERRRAEGVEAAAAAAGAGGEGAAAGGVALGAGAIDPPLPGVAIPGW